ncbi:MAG: tetratricopeptide repeat protein [Chitinispirillaceae bacterium]|nr:tetratricopeptide repeat protein [Chitinispirillaceae bacterium]
MRHNFSSYNRQDLLLPGAIIARPRRCCIFPAIAVYIGLAAAVAPASASLLDEANEQYGRGKFFEAIRLYKKAVSEGENLTLGYFNLGNAYFQIDSIPQSIVYYRAAVDEAPDFFRGHLNLAIAYYTLEDMGGCIASISRALELEPGDKKALLIRAASYRKAGALPEAITAFEQLYAADKGSPDVIIALGEMYRDLDDFETARLWLDRYPESGSNARYVLAMLAEMYEQQGVLDKTLYYLQKAREADAANRWLSLRICQIHEKSGNRRVAYEEAKASLLRFPDFGDLVLFAANCAFKLEQWGEAEHFYELARKLGCPGAVAGLENVREVRNGEAARHADEPSIN